MAVLEYPLGSCVAISLLPLHLYRAINSDFIVYLAITVCFMDFHETASPLSVNT